MSRIYQLGGVFYVDTVNGSDSNNGSQAHPWKTIAGAFCILRANYDFGGESPSLNVMSGSTITEAVEIPQLQGAPQLNLLGNLDMANLIPWAVPSGQTGIEAHDHKIAIVKGFHLYGGANLLMATQGGILDYDFIDFGATSNAQIYMQGTGAMNGGTGSNCAISGSAPYHLQITGAGGNHALSGVTINVASGLTFSSFVRMFGPSMINWGFNYFTQNVNGSKFNMTAGARFYTGGTTMPGTSYGSVSADSSVY